jgi:hypothetical protein
MATYVQKNYWKRCFLSSQFRGLITRITCDYEDLLRVCTKDFSKNILGPEILLGTSKIRSSSSNHSAKAFGAIEVDIYKSKFITAVSFLP